MSAIDKTGDDMSNCGLDDNRLEGTIHQQHDTAVRDDVYSSRSFEFSACSVDQKILTYVSTFTDNFTRNNTISGQQVSVIDSKLSISALASGSAPFGAPLPEIGQALPFLGKLSSSSVRNVSQLDCYRDINGESNGVHTPTAVSDDAKTLEDKGTAVGVVAKIPMHRLQRLSRMLQETVI
jgi:hypothetical protein